MANAAGIRHPQPSRRWPTHFAAYGFLPGVASVSGHLRHQTLESKYAGTQVRPPSKTTGFWVIRFVLPDDFPVSDNDKYALEIFNADPTEGALILSSVPDLMFFRRRKRGPMSANVSPEGGNVSVTYPQDYDEVGSEFAAYGTAPNSLSVSGAYSGCSGTITQGDTGPNWLLYCFDQGPRGSLCTLTVYQDGATPGQGTFEIAPA